MDDEPAGGRFVSHALPPGIGSLVSYDSRGEPGTHLGVPSTSATVVLPLGDPLRMRWNAEPVAERAMSTCVSGLHLEPALVRHAGRQRGLQLALTPRGCRAVLGMPVAEVTGRMVAIEDVLPQWREVSERLHGAPTWTERVAILTRLVRRRLEEIAETRLVRPEIDEAMRLLRTATPVAEAAGAIGYSRRRLSTLFAAELGISPKEYQRVARFERARPDVVAAVGRGGGLAEVALTHGYADQSHLTREWRALAGRAPARWVREEFPSVQDHHPGDRAD